MAWSSTRLVPVQHVCLFIADFYTTVLEILLFVKAYDVETGIGERMGTSLLECCMNFNRGCACFLVDWEEEQGGRCVQDGPRVT